MVTATLATTPQLWQSLYWQTGAITYLLPVVLGTAYLGALWRLRGAWLCGRRTWTWVLASVVLVVVAVGCSETALAAVDAGLAFAIVASFGWYREADRRVRVTILRRIEGFDVEKLRNLTLCLALIDPVPPDAAGLRARGG